MRTVWITRALPGARATAARVKALGFEPLMAPLIEIGPTGEGPLDLGPTPGALAFTSANGVRAFCARSEIRDLPVFAVGDTTARVARDAGFPDVRSAEGNVADLAAFIQAGPRAAGPIIHLAAAEPAGDLVGSLGEMGIPARRVAVYESRDAQMAVEAVGDLLEADLILLHSPRAAAALARVMTQNPGQAPAVLCLSSAVAAPLGDLAPGRLFIAEAPNEDALMALLAARGAGP